MKNHERWRRFVWLKGDVEPVSGRARTAEDIAAAKKGFDKLFGRELKPAAHSVEPSNSDIGAAAHH
ncbi:hypothetical protein [Methanospirillum sp.]|uniref:hypothetical protein n=1 Tax=Methanospirillum sp. TaxID=45200 RepID=UPI0035A0691D